MEKPILVVMAAGMGSRYGGMKQLDPVGPSGEVIMDYSLFDARRAGFETVVFIIKEEMREAFSASVGARLAGHMQVKYAFQRVGDLPEGYAVPNGRTKPWGTCHAVMSAAAEINGPFAVINADDYYGPNAFRVLYEYLSTHPDDSVYEYCMVGYQLANTVTENGSVSRGVCQTDSEGYLASITERTRIEKHNGGIDYTEDDGATWLPLAADVPVSMNLWGFTRRFITEAEARFPAFLDKALAENPMKAEYYLPSVVSALLAEKKARVRVLSCADKWHGVTYKEDKPTVVAAIHQMVENGLYPAMLWA